MSTSTAVDSGIATLAAPGDLTDAFAGDFVAELRALAAGDDATIALDLAAATVVSASAMGKILLFQRRLHEQGRRLFVSACSHEVHDLLRLLHVDKLLDVRR
jgi:anti-anti-sigma regulatory factor